MRTLHMVSGVFLVVLGVVIAPLPGPGGLPVALAGAIVLLRASPALRRRWVRAARRWPGVVGPMDAMLRRMRRKRRDASRPAGTGATMGRLRALLRTRS